VSSKLTLRSPLLERLSKRIESFLYFLLRDSKGSDKAKALRFLKDAAIVNPTLIASSILLRVSDEFIMDDNANVRCSVVELLSEIVLAKMRHSEVDDDANTQEAFHLLSSRKGDISPLVRKAILAFLKNVTALSRPKAPLLPFERYSSLVGAHINKHSEGASWDLRARPGRVVGFDQTSAIFKVEYGRPNTSSSQNECEDIPFDVLKHLLVLETNAKDPSVGDAARGFAPGHRFVQSCSQLCTFMQSEEETVLKLARSALEELWFTAADLPGANACVEEIVASINAEFFRNDSAWFENLLSQLPAKAEERAKQYVNHLFAKLSAIHNVSPVASTGGDRPSTFNDFDTRARLLLPVLQAIKPFAKKKPLWVFPHLSKILPALATLELSIDHVAVLCALRDILGDAVGSKKDFIAVTAASLQRQLQLAESEETESEKAHKGKNNKDKGRHKALGSKVLDLKAQLAEWKDKQLQPTLPLSLENELIKTFAHGAFKMSDLRRFPIDEAAKFTQTFCAVINCNRTPSSLTHLLKTVVQYGNILQKYIGNPTEEMARWIPRTLVLFGSIIRFFDFSSVSAAQLGSQDAALPAAAREAKEKFLVLCLSKFANSTRELFKAAALHALGSVFVREPELLRHNTVMKLMTKSLSPNEPQSIQLQVLKNFNTHFMAEEADLVVASTSGESSEGTSVTVMVSDTSTSITHHFLKLILETSLSPSPRVREQAVLLITTIIHRGLTGVRV